MERKKKYQDDNEWNKSANQEFNGIRQKNELTSMKCYPLHYMGEIQVQENKPVKSFVPSSIELLIKLFAM